jgi:OmpA-OmpF porin, OOP family
VSFSVAAGARLADRKLVLGPELWGSTFISEGDAVFGARTTPLALVFGGHYTAGDWRFGAGMGPGLSHAAGTAAFRALLGVEWMPEVAPKGPTDRDGDGIHDDVDACPDVAGVASEDPKADGCPIADRDRDGIVDKEDACPDEKGTKTDDPKTNGCPDRDKDGIVDGQDACPDVAGVKTDDPQTNGCPPDRDHDGVPDDADACPDVPGVKTEDPKTNGCPPDRDKDGIADPVDACPDAPGPSDPDPKKNGCPLARIEAQEVKILEQIKFKFGSAEPLRESQPIVDAVAKVLADHPEVKRVRIEGHTDNKGAPAYNKDLSKRRAAAIVAGLVRAGIEPARLYSAGFGPDKPLDTNATDEGRANNRRVEFHIEGGSAP